MGATRSLGTDPACRKVFMMQSRKHMIWKKKLKTKKRQINCLAWGASAWQDEAVCLPFSSRPATGSKSH